MRKRSYLWMLGGMILIAGSIIMIQNNIKDTDPRGDYEKFLTDQMEVLKGIDTETVQEMPKMDRPDLAGIQEYLRTVDPELKAVPNWRTIDAHNQLKQAQVNFKSGQEQLDWTHHTTNMGGRTRAIMYDPNDATNSKVWAGSVTGGLWYTPDAIGGQPWVAVNDFYSNLSISSLAYDPNNKTTFFAGTGESQTALVIYRESSGRGSGLYKSSDAGVTWNLIPSTSDWAYVTDVIVRNEDGVSAIYAGVVSGIYHGKLHESAPADGLYRSIDDGESWTQVLPLVPSGNRPYAPSDIELNSDGSRIFIGTTYHWDDREGAACILYSDNGTDWTVNSDYYNMFEDGLEMSGNSRIYNYPGRVILSASPNNTGIVYAAIAGGYVRSDQFIGYDCVRIVKTEDTGTTWSSKTVPMRDNSNTFAYLAWHAMEITVSPFNPNMIWVGGLDVFRSSNSGDSWTKYTNWAGMYGNGSDDYVHADIHSILYKPGSDTDMIIATDGGIFGTRTAPAVTPVFFELNRNYSTLQYYSCAIHPDAGAMHFMGGLQDNGTLFYHKGIIPTFKDMLSGGDGALCFIDEDNPKIHLTTVYHNSIYLYNAEKETAPESKRSRGFNSGMFVNAMDYNSAGDVLIANRMNEQGDNPNQIEVIGVTETNLSGSSRNLATDITVPYTSVKCSEYSPSGKTTVFLGSMAGHIFKQEDAAAVGTLTNLTPDDFPTAHISSIDHGQSEDTLLLTFSNYGVESVWFTTDGGQSWANKEGNLPDVPIRWGLIHPVNGKQVMLATELGTWTTTDITAEPAVWTQNINGMANVRVDQIEVRKSDNTVLAATHGRGMYTSIWHPVYTSGITESKQNKEFVVFPNPSRGEFEVKVNTQGNSKIIITDASGRIVESISDLPKNQSLTKSFNLTSEPKGIYFISIINGSEKEVSRLILQ